MDEKRMRLRYAGTCRVCDADLPAKAEAVYERATRTVRCVSHEDAPETPAAPPVVRTEALAPREALAPARVEAGVPGASARREFERRSAKREEHIRTAHPKLGGLILTLSADPQSTRAWDTGAVGEERLGARLNELSCDTLRVLHDRRIPGTRANIDHLAVTPTGVWVIDAKNYAGRPHLRVEGGFLGPRVEKLMVGSRDRTKLVDGVLKQVDVVRAALGADVPVHGALCFVEADWPLIGGTFTTREVLAVPPKKLCARLRTPGPFGTDEIDRLHAALAAALPLA